MATTGAAMVMFEVVGSFQAKRLLSDARAQMNIMNAIMLNGLSGVHQAVDQITEQMDALVDSTVPLAQEFAMARIQFDKFMGETENLSEVREEIKNIGLQFGFTADKALEAGAKMAQLKDVVGGEGSVVAATEVGIKFALIGDMETQDAMQKMVNLQQQTNFMFGGMAQAQIEAMDAEERANFVRANSMKTLTQLNTVENRSAATMQQITFIMNQFASQAHMTGESIADMAANAAVMVESGEEMGKAGRALKMIYARLGSDTHDNNKILQAYGVQVRDTHGNLLPLSDIVQQLAQQFPKLEDAEKQHIAQIVAGNDHYVRFLKLVEGADRQQVLSTQAALGLSDAQEEVNIKLDDQATKLKKLQAELKNTEAAMGTAFIPAQMKATKQQISFNRALTDLYTSGAEGPLGGVTTDLKALATLDFQNFDIMDAILGSVVKKGMDFAFAFQRVQKVMGPVVEAMINIKSLSVAMQTQQTILRAMQGEQLVNPQIYNQAAQSQQLTTELAIQEFQVRSRIKSAGATALQFQKEGQSLGMNELRRMYMQNSAAADINILASQRRGLSAEIAGIEGQILNAVKQGEQAQNSILATIRARAAANQLMSTQELETVRNAVAMRSQELMVINQEEQAMRNRHAIEMASASTSLTTVHNAKNEVGLVQKLIDMKVIESDLGAKILSDGRFKLEVSEQDLLMARQSLELEKLMSNESNKRRGENLQMMVARLVQNEQLTLSLSKHMNAQDLLNTVSAEEIAIIERVTSKKFIKNELTDQEAIALKVLTTLLKENNMQSEVQIQNLFEIIMAQTAHGATQDAMMAKQMAMNATMTKYSGILGGASALITLFDDSSKGAKASMALMMPVMIMSTVQMMQMTNSMLSQATAGMGAAVANNTLSFSLKGVAAAAGAAAAGMKAFIASTGIGLIVVGAITAATYLFSDGVDNMSEGVIEFNGHLTDSLTLLTDLRQTGLEPALEDVPQMVRDAFAEAGINSDTISELGLEETQQAIEIVKNEMDELREKAGDGATVQERLFMMQLEASQKYIGALQTQETLLIAQLVLQGELMEMQKKMSEGAMDNAKSALSQFEDEYEDEYDDAMGMGILNFVTSGQSMGGYVEDVSQKDIRKSAAAIIAAFQSEEGLNLSSAEIEDLLEVLGNYTEGWLSFYDNSAAAMGAYTEDFGNFIDKNFDKKTLEMLSTAIDDTGDFNTPDVAAYKEIIDELEDQFAMTTEEAQFLVDEISNMGSDGMGAIDDITESIENLGETMMEFNNNREAMFFGLSQSGISGDFVKQVQNKGVENLIANTELIVTNNFNGMLLHEMVDTIKDEVVSALVDAGVVRSGAVD